MAEDNFKNYINVMAQTGVYPNKDNLVFLTKTLFNDIDFKNKRVLDIGGGAGFISFFAASCGAKEVINLEPVKEGSTAGIKNKFQNIKSLLCYKNVFLEDIPFQYYNSEKSCFDVVILYDSINHLDEDACINLLKSDKSYNKYVTIFNKIASLSHTGTILILCDCSRKNFFPQLGIKNPFAPTIEWQKHHEPYVWVKILSQVGFISPRISWMSFNRLRSLGRFIFGNKIMAYFFNSCFCIKMEKA